MNLPELLDGAPAVREWRDRLGKGRVLGFVPTMGALHEGHLSLIRAAKKESDRVVVSVYVNPIQFGPGEDLGTYHRDIEKDRELVGSAGGDAVATFSDAGMYPPGFSTYVDVDSLTRGLCGKSRPGHFRGVTTVVTKLFHVVMPHRAYFGQKDAQQAAVIRRMTRDLDFGVEIRVMPTVREEDGLAMSSRNAYLSPLERGKARCLYASLTRAKEMARDGERDVKVLLASMAEVIKDVGGESARIEYIEIVDPESLEPIERIGGNALAAMAVKVGPARLIDNVLLIG